MSDTPLAVSIPEARRQLGGLSRATIYRLLNSDKLESRKIGSRTVILVSSIHALLEAA